LLGHLKFRAAYDFLLLRCESGELDGEIAEWWKKFSGTDEAARAEMLLKDSAPGPAKRRRRRRRHKPGEASTGESAES
jgi:poly(A) polymerase